MGCQSSLDSQISWLTTGGEGVNVLQQWFIVGFLCGFLTALFVFDQVCILLIAALTWRGQGMIIQYVSIHCLIWERMWIFIFVIKVNNISFYRNENLQSLEYKKDVGGHFGNLMLDFTHCNPYSLHKCWVTEEIEAIKCVCVCGEYLCMHIPGTQKYGDRCWYMNTHFQDLLLKHYVMIIFWWLV